jgi:outer membrane receptor protein involved in Fe transport
MSAHEAVERLINGTKLEIASIGDDGLVVRPTSEKQTNLSRSSNLSVVDTPIRLAQAQSAPDQPTQQSSSADSAIEQVVVSASRITIAGYTAPTPVTVVGAAQLESDAFANIADAVRELPQVTAPPASESTSLSAGGPGNTGANFLNLRNLGITRTLVLFDGQRVVASNITGGVDVTTLPSTIIQRVDVVTGGASAAWGSDAVAGVVNFVLNKNFTGLKASVQGGTTSDSPDRDFTAQAAWGGDIFGGRGHLVLAAKTEIRPDLVLLINENWWRGTYMVSNPAYLAGNGQPQLIVANNVGLAQANNGGIITSSPAGTGAPANALRGIEFVGAGIPQLVNFGNVTLGSLSNGGSLTEADTAAAEQGIADPNNTYTFFGYGRYKLTDSIQASLQLNYGYFTGKGGTPSGTQTALVIKSDNAYIPASVRATMQADGITSFTMGTLNVNNINSNTVNGDDYFSIAEGGLGPAVAFLRRQLDRGVFTLEGTIGNDWSWNTYYEHSTSRLWIHDDADLNFANLAAAEDAVTVTTANRGTSTLPLGSIVCRSSLPGQAAVVSGTVTAQSGCIPLDVFGNGVASPNAVGYVTGGDTNFEDMQLNQDVVEGSMQGTLPWQLPAGPVAVAFGAGYRKEAGKNVANPLGAQAAFATADFTNFPSSSYSVMEGFAEVDAPILKNNIVNSLDFSMAGRMTSYSTSGLVETWKLGLTSQVNDDVKLRTTWSVDIRAPQLSDLFTPGAVNFTSYRDPKTQLTVNAYTVQSGNPNLLPEVARTVSGGVVLTPTFLDGFSLSVDWYSINLTNGLGTLSTTVILDQCNSTLPSNIYPGQNGNINDPLCTHLVFAGPGGALSQVNNNTINIASQTTSGLDLQANYSMDFWEGNIAWAANTNLNDENTAFQPGSGTNDSAGTAGTPKWRGLLSADYSTGPYSFTVQSRWNGTSKQTNLSNTGNLATAATANLYPTSVFEIPFVAYLDLRASYKWNDNIQFYGAIDNATDVPPALVPTRSSTITSNGSITGTNTTTYDMLGRQFRLGIRFNY